MKIAKYLAGACFGVCLITPVLAESNQAIGWIEHVSIPSKNITFVAKIDTGADNSSLHATDITVYEQKGNKRVKFAVKNKESVSTNFDLPLLRIANIKRKLAEPLKRPVVNMMLCVGNTLKSVPVNLANRGNFKYRMLIGRSFLKDNFVVNSSEKFTSKPACSSENLAANN
jgi:hypothetical protein